MRTWARRTLTASGTLTQAAAALILAVGATLPAAAVDISGAGATFPYPVYAKWAEAYKAKTGVAMNYQSIGSGGGIKQIEAKTVDFGASDKPLEPKDLDANGLLQFPMIMGGVVPVVNIKGIGAGQVKLTGAVLAEIYLGKVKRWNDPAIKSLNGGLALPDEAISVVHRSDGSGTTFIFTHYLSEMSPEWKQKVGEDASVAWPAAGSLGGKGNEGVASYASRINGAIGYVEYAYALQNKLAYVLLQNKAGKYVKPSAETFQAAAANANWAKAPGFFLLLTDQPGAESWPITGASFILVYKNPPKPENTKQVLDFFDWAYHNGAQMASQLDYVPIPANVIKLVEDTWKAQIKAGGKPVWAATPSKAGDREAAAATPSKAGGRPAAAAH
ncbi:MAG TPA: phosphate ABC transporter substrate-binding protein PstS [Caulobacteraceae bacterium]|nr:phosphate ABC transporter substrate-binding protein PstS [Caulobacteraceae bacterium]